MNRPSYDLFNESGMEKRYIQYIVISQPYSVTKPILLGSVTEYGCFYYTECMDFLSIFPLTGPMIGALYQLFHWSFKE